VSGGPNHESADSPVDGLRGIKRLLDNDCVKNGGQRHYDILRFIGRCVRTCMDKKAQFFKVYANLPQASREEIVAVVGNEPYTWQVARLEIEQDTPIGKEILETLVKLKILPE